MLSIITRLVLGYFVFTLLPATNLFGQLNMELKGLLKYPQRLNDVWGWVDANDGTEYALVGTSTGVSIVSLKNPLNPVEVAFASGASSNWRDIKTWGEFAYATNESGGGLMVIDLKHLPDSISFYDWSPQISGFGQLKTAHNLYIDEQGFCYLAGTNLNNGGILISDVVSNPGKPAFIAFATGVYAHDVFVQNGRLYASELYKGAMSIYDISDKRNTKLLATQQTPYNFTHNIWVNESATLAFTSDEKSNAPVTAYDISNLSQIRELDQFRPKATLGTGVIPHNVHVKKDWLLISNYTDGVIVVDASRPANLVEVANWDTYPEPVSGLNGAWGVYPYLPSGLVLVSDIQNGLFICKPNYVRACWLEGRVTDSQSGKPILGAQIRILSEQPNETITNVEGRYKTGQAAAGNFTVEIFAKGYYPKLASVELANAKLTILNVQLEPLVQHNLSGTVVSEFNGVPVPFAQVLLQNEHGEFIVKANQDGKIKLTGVFAGTYTLYASAWGFQSIRLGSFRVASNLSDFAIPLKKGYQDDFLFDHNWTTIAHAATGRWVRGKPRGTTSNGTWCNPPADVEFDYGDMCYMTGNGGGSANTDDVDNGSVILFSPEMDLTAFKNPILGYSTWFVNLGGSTAPNDTLLVYVSNGLDTVLIERISHSAGEWKPATTVALKNVLKLTPNMKVIFKAEDKPDSDHVVEAAIDAFFVLDASDSTFIKASSDEGCFPRQVQFYDLTNSVSQWEWKFEGGFPASSNLKNPLIEYQNPGSFDVELSARNKLGIAQYQKKTALIKTHSVPESDFSFNISGRTVHFKNTSLGGSSFYWNFGDGIISMEANPRHIYELEGTYRVTLEAINNCSSSLHEKLLQIKLTPTQDHFETVRVIFNSNPFSEELTMHYESPGSWQNARIEVFNMFGQLMEQKELSSASGSISLGGNWPPGQLFFVRVKTVTGIIAIEKVVKR